MGSRCSMAEEGLDLSNRVVDQKRGDSSMSQIANSSKFDPPINAVIHCSATTLTLDDLPPDGSDYRGLLLEVLQKNSSISTLLVRSASSLSSRVVAECLQAAPNITHVKFVGSKSDDTLARLLGMQLQPVWVRPPSLQCLVIANPRRNLLTDRGVRTIADSLEENKSLKTLVLFGTYMGDGAARALTAALEHNTTLEELVFYGKGLSGRGIDAFAEWIISGRLGVHELVVGGSEFNDVDAQVLASAVVNVDRPCPLRKFGMLNTLLGDASASALARVIISGLTEVILLIGQLSNEGVEVLAEAVVSRSSKDKASLHNLYLTSEVATDEGLVFFEKPWASGCPAETLELAFGGASKPGCLDLMSKAVSGSRLGSEWNGCRRLYATNGVFAYLEEVMFSRLMARASSF